jgi:hypothetical protein
MLGNPHRTKSQAISFVSFVHVKGSTHPVY